MMSLTEDEAKTWAAGAAAVAIGIMGLWNRYFRAKGDLRNDDAGATAQSVLKGSIAALTEENTRLRGVIERQEGQMAEQRTVIERLRVSLDEQRALRIAAEDREAAARREVPAVLKKPDA